MVAAPGRALAAQGGSLFVTIGFLPETTRDEIFVVRGVRTAGASVAIKVNGEVQSVGNPPGTIYRSEIVLSPGENQIEVVAALGETLVSEQARLFRRTAQFADLDQHWAQESVEVLATIGLVNGMGNNAFAPDAQVTRAQFAKLVTEAIGLRPVAAPDLQFADAEDIPAWAGPYVAAAVNARLMKGYEDRSFRPDFPITRLEMAVIAARALRLRYHVPVGPPVTLSDQSAIPEWARTDVTMVAQAGLLSGFADTTFYPRTHSTRAEAAVITYRVWKITR